MARRKQADYDERRQQIIDGALDVFSTKGFIEATNKDIADATKINSPGLIYHYFKNKEDLLRAVIEHYGSPMQLLARSEALMSLPPEQALTQFGQLYLRVMSDSKISACRRILIGEAMRSPEFAEVLGRVGPLRLWKLLAVYLKQKMDEGVLQQVDPMMAAQCFVGPLAARLIEQVIRRVDDDSSQADAELLIRTNVRIFLHGLEVG